MPTNSSLFDSTLFENLAQEVGLVLFDVGSRGGVSSDFLPVAKHTSVAPPQSRQDRCADKNP